MGHDLQRLHEVVAGAGHLGSEFCHDGLQWQRSMI
jgi:hypothetical protein